MLDRLARRMNLTPPIRLLESADSIGPAVIGWVRPAILIPAGMATGLGPTELESILDHELAHIRRLDYLVNLIQSVVETLLFYHPAVWWVSRRIQVEREHCCDDIAIEVCGDRLAFARALTRLEAFRFDSGLAVAAHSGSLLARIRRIAEPRRESFCSWWCPGGLVVVAFGLVVVGAWFTVAIAASQPVPPSSKASQAARSQSNPSTGEESGARPEPSDWGPLAKGTGFRLRLTLTTDHPQVGKPLMFKLELKNFGAKPATYDPQELEPFRVLVARASLKGKSPAFIAATPQTSGRDREVKPGQTVTVWEKVDANNLYLFEDGTYRFRVRGRRWDSGSPLRESNWIIVNIAPGKRTAGQRFIAELLKGLAKGWSVESALHLAPGWKAINLHYRPTNLKRDAASIRIWFSAKRLRPDAPRQTGLHPRVITYVGSSPLGHVNVAADRQVAGRIWPTYNTYIRDAVARTFPKPNGEVARDE